MRRQTRDFGCGKTHHSSVSHIRNPPSAIRNPSSCPYLAFFILLIIFSSFLNTAFAETRYPIATNFSADGKVLELDVPPALDGERFPVVIENDHSETSITLYVARVGRHSYEMRHLPDWHGTVKYVGIIDVAGIEGRVKEPTLADNVDMFLEPERITPSTINLLLQHHVFGWSWTMCLLLILAASSIFFGLVRRKPPITALVLGFLVAWSLMELRIVFDHASIVYREETLHRGMRPLTEVKQFADRASPVIDGMMWTWGHKPTGGPEKYLDYRFAEHPYAVAGSGRVPALWVTEDSATSQILLQQRPPAEKTQP